MALTDDISNTPPPAKESVEEWQRIIKIMLDVHSKYLPKDPLTHEVSEVYMYMAKRIAKATTPAPEKLAGRKELDYETAKKVIDEFQCEDDYVQAHFNQFLTYGEYDDNTIETSNYWNNCKKVVERGPTPSASREEGSCIATKIPFAGDRFDATPAPVNEKDRGKMVDANETWEDIIGYIETQQFIGTKYETVIAELKKSFTTPKPYQ